MIIQLFHNKLCNSLITLLYSAKEGLFQQTVLNNICNWISYIWLPHTQNQAYNFTRNGLLVLYTFILHSVFPWRMAGLLFVAVFFQTLSKPQVENWRHSVVMALMEWYVMNWDFTESLPLVISSNLEWFDGICAYYVTGFDKLWLGLHRDFK